MGIFFIRKVMILIWSRGPNILDEPLGSGYWRLWIFFASIENSDLGFKVQKIEFQNENWSNLSTWLPDTNWQTSSKSQLPKTQQTFRKDQFPIFYHSGHTIYVCIWLSKEFSHGSLLSHQSLLASLNYVHTYMAEYEFLSIHPQTPHGQEKNNFFSSHNFYPIKSNNYPFLCNFTAMPLIFTSISLPKLCSALSLHDNINYLILFL